MLNTLKRYVHIWLRLTFGSFQIAFISRPSAFIFTSGKILRFAFFLLIIFMIVTKTQTLAGYTVTQVLVFYLVFNIIDTLTQLLFRDVYRFRSHVVSGYFDYILIKPMSPLFKVLLGGADPLDLFMLVPFLIFLGVLISHGGMTLTATGAFILLIINSFLIATAFHIFVLGLGILTTEVDHTIMIYRDISTMARFPVDIYQEPLKGFITFIIPVGVMMTFPAKALFGLLTPGSILFSLLIGVGSIVISLRFWRIALTQYTSASS